MVFNNKKINKGTGNSIIERDYPENNTQHAKHPNRKFGQWGRDDKKIKMLWAVIVIIYAAMAVFSYFVQYGYFTIIVVTVILFGGELIFKLVIKIPYSCVLVVYLDETKNIDSIEIVYIPIHLIYWEYEIMGNHAPLQNVNPDGGFIYISDKFDKDNKIIYLSWDNRFSNLRYIAHKGAFLEIKEELKKYGILNLRRILVEDVSVMGVVELVLTKFNDAMFNEPDKYYRQGTLQKDAILGTENEIIKSLQDKTKSDIRQNKLNDDKDGIDDNIGDKK